LKILIIEDDTFFQKLYQSKLHEKGFEVEIANDGEEGIEKIHTFKPDILLLDLIMPKKNGFEVLEFLSKDKTLQRIPVIVFSTLGQEQDIEKAKKLGAKDYITKGFLSFDELEEKIEKVSER